MKTKRLLSLLLAITVMATMLIALPLTGYAAQTGVGSITGLTAISSTKTLDMADYSSEAANSAWNSAEGVSSDGYLYYYKLATFGTGTAVVGNNKYSTTANVKGTDGRSCGIKVNGACTITAYGYVNNSARALGIFDSNGSLLTTNTTSVTYYGDSSNSTQYVSYNYTGTSEACFYIAAATGSDTRLNLITVEFTSTEPVLSLNKDTLTLNQNETATLTATASNMGDSQEITWSSDNESVATVDETGVVTAVSAGDATITASTTYNGTTYTATCKVTVNAYEAVTGVKITTNGGISGDDTSGYKLGLDKQGTLVATVTPDTATDTAVTWSSSDATIASVDSSSGVVTSNSIGEVTITASAADNQSATITINVVEGTSETKTDNTWTASEALSSGDWLIYNDNITIRSKFASSLNENKADYGGLSIPKRINVRANSVSENIVFTESSGSTVLAVRPKVDGYLTLVYRRQPDSGSTPDSSTAAGGKDVKVADASGTGQTQSEFTKYVGDATDYFNAVSTYKLTAGTTYYMYASGTTIQLGSINFAVFGDNNTDSGTYTGTDGSTQYGVIRYLQEYADPSDVTKYGFFFMDANGEITDFEISKSSDEESLENGFYGDLDGIEDQDESYYAAKPFVVVDGNTIQGDSITGTVEWNRSVDYTETTE